MPFALISFLCEMVKLHNYITIWFIGLILWMHLFSHKILPPNNSQIWGLCLMKRSSESLQYILGQNYWRFVHSDKTYFFPKAKLFTKLHSTFHIFGPHYCCWLSHFQNSTKYDLLQLMLFISEKCEIFKKNSKYVH